MGEEDIREERFYRIGQQEVSLLTIDLKGRILDIGGGGEGVIGRIYRDRVIAIDPNKQELEDAPEGPLKLVMDARELLFLDGSFETVTSFFTMMFIPNAYHEQIFKEAYRVLKPGGEFHLWDVNIPPYDNGPKDIYVVPLSIKLMEETIHTGFGTRWTNKLQNMDYFMDIARRVGFECSFADTEGVVLRLIFNRKQQ